MKYHILASGSTGNATLIESAHHRVLVDCGISLKKIREKLAVLNLSVEDLDLVLVTHGHGDHMRALPQISKIVPIGMTHRFRDHVDEKLADNAQTHLFEAGSHIQFGDLKVGVHALSHDCVDPVAFTLETEEHKIGVLSDLGQVDRHLIKAFEHCSYLLLEANHDIGMLTRSSRPMGLKNRILSRVGHLSNRASARFLRDIFSQRLLEVTLVHLSEDCNTPDLALKAMYDELNTQGLSFDRFAVASREGLLQEH